jgi:serine O-acetyltransferase
VAANMRIKSFADLRALWKEDYRTNGRRLYEPGFQALAIYRFGVWVDGIRFAPLRYPLRKLYFFLYALMEVAYGIRLYYTAEIGRRLQLAHAQCGVIIARRCRIGDDCILRQNVTVGKLRSRAPDTAVPVLGNRIEIGAGAVLVGPISVGDDAVIGANVVVREDVPAGAVVLPPAPVIKESRNRAAADPQPIPAGWPEGEARDPAPCRENG